MAAQDIINTRETLQPLLLSWVEPEMKVDCRGNPLPDGIRWVTVWGNGGEFRSPGTLPDPSRPLTPV